MQAARRRRQLRHRHCCSSRKINTSNWRMDPRGSSENAKASIKAVRREKYLDDADLTPVCFRIGVALSPRRPAGKPLDGIAEELAIETVCYGAVQPVRASVRELWVVWSTLLPGVTLIGLLIAGDDVQVNSVEFREVFIDPSARPSIM